MNIKFNLVFSPIRVLTVLIMISFGFLCLLDLMKGGEITLQSWVLFSKDLIIVLLAWTIYDMSKRGEK